MRSIMMMRLAARTFASVCVLAIFVLVGCSSKSGTAGTSGRTAGSSGRTFSQSAGVTVYRTPAPNAPESVRIADIAYNRLGGSKASGNIQVTSVSIVGEYGLAVVQIGAAQNETLFKRERSGWRPLASDAFLPDGRGLLRFGVTPDLAHALVENLRPLPPGS
jgi:hypothetical protein